MFAIPESVIIYINPLLILIFLILLYRGYKKGFILQVLDLISLGVAAIIAWLFAPVFARIYSIVTIQPTALNALDTTINEALNQLAWFGILLVVIRLLLLVVTPLASMISKMPLIKQVNSVVGGAFSIVVYCIYIIGAIFFLSLPLVTNGNTVVENSALKYVRDVSSPVLSTVQDTLNRNSALQSLLTNRSLTEDQEDQVITWLQGQGFTQSAIREFLGQYE